MHHLSTYPIVSLPFKEDLEYIYYLMDMEILLAKVKVNLY